MTNNLRNNKYKKSRIISISQSPDKEGRLDCLLLGVGALLTHKLEQELSLPGLAAGLFPILEDEIKKVIKPENIIPESYRELSRVLSRHVNEIVSRSSMEFPIAETAETAETAEN